MNRATLMGNITKDIEIIQTSAGVAIAKCGLATNERFKKKGSEEYENITTFHNLVAFAHNANHLNKWFKKGSPILIEGKISNTTWDKEDGTKGYKSEIIIDQMHFVGGKKEDSNTTSQYDNQPRAQSKPSWSQGDGVKKQREIQDYISVEDIPF